MLFILIHGLRVQTELLKWNYSNILRKLRFVE